VATPRWFISNGKAEFMKIIAGLLVAMFEIVVSTTAMAQLCNDPGGWFGEQKVYCSQGIGAKCVSRCLAAAAH
jgi:hypothetical protein